MTDPSEEANFSRVNTTQLGTAPQRKRHREGHIQHAYTIQRDAAIKGMIIWTFIGASTCFMAHHLFPGFRRQTLALKGFLTSGATIFGLCTGAEEVLQSHESQQRTEENLIRKRAMQELGKKGVVASEAEIERWRIEARDNLIEKLRKQREADATKAAVPSPVASEGQEEPSSMVDAAGASSSSS
ncbi:unnamed protein product [Parajaminaea phylloscopi]